MCNTYIHHCCYLTIYLENFHKDIYILLPLNLFISKIKFFYIN